MEVVTTPSMAQRIPAQRGRLTAPFLAFPDCCHLLPALRGPRLGWQRPPHPPEPRHARCRKCGGEPGTGPGLPPAAAPGFVLPAGSPEEVSCYWETAMAGCSRGSPADKRPLCSRAAMAAAPEHPAPCQSQRPPRAQEVTQPVCQGHQGPEQLPKTRQHRLPKPQHPTHGPLPIPPAAAPKMHPLHGRGREWH